MLSFGLFLLVVSSCTALSVQELLLSDDSTSFVDNVITNIKLLAESEAPAPDFVFSFNTPKGQTNTGNLSATQGSAYDFQSFKRIGPVVSIPSGGNLTLQTNIAFDKLGAKYNVVDLNLLGVHTQVQADVIVCVNQFFVDLTIYSNKTGRCSVDLKKAAFTALSGVKVSVKPLGFFNQITLNADIFHVTENILSEFDVNNAALQTILENQICKNIPN